MNKVKICLLLSASIICIYTTAYAKEAVTEDLTVQNLQQENIKANKATYEKAVEAVNNKDFENAIIYLSAYINSKPQKYEAYKLRADAYYALRQYSLALKDYQTAIDIKTSDDKFMTNTKYVSAVILGADKNEQLQNPELGNLYGRLMYAQKALNDINYETSYTQALKYNSHIYLPQPVKEDIVKINCPQKYGKVLNPQGADEYIYGAIDDIEKGDYTSAIFKSQSVISTYPKYYLGYYLNGVALSGLEKDDDAIVAFNKALELNPNDFESMASLGNIYFDKAQVSFSEEDAQTSIRYFKQALKYNPANYLYHFYIGMNELQLGNAESSIAEFNSAVKIKPNDYNSLYYKLIAQYIKGNYNQVINGATKLLYKHVSNSNSVLYLRALAEFKVKEYDKASEDLDSIFGNIEDIYNADVKIVSEKEKCLESYVYYLKAKIAQVEGYGAKSDLEKAYKNPIINRISQAQNAIKPYNKMLSQETVSQSDFDKFNSFYQTALPKLLHSGIVISEQDIDYQYDYIRTTFDDMGLAIVYTNPDYKLTVAKDFPYKKYGMKLSAAAAEKTAAENTNSSADTTKMASTISRETTSSTQNSPIQGDTNTKSTLKESTSQEEMLAPDYETSLARMLATSSYGMLGPVSAEKEKTILNAPEVVKKEPVVIDEKTASNALSGEDFVFTNKPSSVNDENSKNVKKIMNDESEMDNSAISVEKSASENTPEKNYEINEKHAGFSPDTLKIRPKTPEISEKDEVIVLDKTVIDLNQNSDKQASESETQENPINSSNNDQLQDNKEVNNNVKQEDEPSETQSTDSIKEEEEEEEITIENKEEKSVTTNDFGEKSEKTVEVPVVNVPEIITPEIPAAQQTSQKENTQETTAEQENATVINIDSKMPQEIAADNQDIEDISEKTSEAADIENEQLEIDKIKIEEEKQAQKEERIKQKQQLKEEAEKKKLEAKALKTAQKEQKKADKIQKKIERNAEKERLKQEKIQAKATVQREKEQAVIEREARKELKKGQKVQETAEKAVKSIQEKPQNKFSLWNLFKKSPEVEKTEPKEVKRTVLKSLSK